MQKIITTPIVLLNFLFYCSCQGPLNSQDYVAWVQDEAHGMHVTQIQDGLLYEVQYKPLEYMILQSTHGVVDSLQYVALQEEMQGLQYYNLSFGLEDKSSDMLTVSTSSEEEKQRLLYYFSYLFKDDIYLEENGNKYPCRLYHFERSYSLKNTNTVVLAFDRIHTDAETATLVVHPKVFDVAPVKIKIQKKNAPKLLL